MRRSVRNRLAESLLRAFEDPGKVDALLWVKLYCDLARRGNRPAVPLLDLLAERERLPDRRDDGASDLASLTGASGLFRVHRADTGEELPGGSGIPAGNIPWMVGLEPEARPALPEVCERTGIYLEVLASLPEAVGEPPGADSLRRAVTQAAACFNAGLFFEAHEHLEAFWRSQPKGPTRRFLQGIIQISVGFHHARRGSYDGAVNQLAKGLEKTAGVTGEILGLDCDTFLPAVAGIWEMIAARGRASMRPIHLHEIPLMPVSGLSRAQRKGEGKDDGRPGGSRGAKVNSPLGGRER
ncbi:MAG TPA: DUF309 domain-containing protein [Candidatus Methylomirabilis sp.]|nr:DUF309 domain-containing protein [Candidatus Methylomirabilis sp.]